jgi:uncharacterized SAM-binding protein YcdF (DUF218 family)
LRAPVLALLRLSALLAGCAVVVTSMVLWPPVREPDRADAVVLLSGDGARLPGALRLMERGVAPTLVFVGTPDVLAVVALCRDPQPFEVVCLRPSPDSTRTEAQATGRLARARRWESMVLVTSRYHIARATLLFGRCFGGTVEAVGDRPGYGWDFARRQIVHEWLAIVHATILARGC